MSMKDRENHKKMQNVGSSFEYIKYRPWNILHLAEQR